MSKIDYQALREAAEKATKGKWAVEFDDEIYSTDGINHEQIAMVFSENESRDAEFIAAANPAAVLALLDELEAAKKRIAELESNEVREVGNQFLVVRHPGKTPVIKHCTGDLEEFLRKLIEQDPLVTIEIITHRYYGIGGQWVQDAVEYLHMMSDAGIRIKGE